MGAFIVLTSVVFLGPALTLGLQEALPAGVPAAFDFLASGLVVLELAILVTILPSLADVAVPSSRRTSLLVVGAIQVIALSNAAFLALGLRWSGLVLELIHALWFAAPLALWALVAWPRSRHNEGDRWVRPMRWILLGFPLIFLAAALARIDFFYYTGFRAPTFLAWLLTYGPTLAGVTLALTGWMAVGRSRSPLGVRYWQIAAVLASGFALAALTSLLPTAAFMVSATVTWGSGYQLFVTPAPLPPLALSLFLVSLASVSLVATLVVFRRDQRPVVLPLLALTAVLSGIFPIARSVLGSLVALQLLRLRAEG